MITPSGRLEVKLVALSLLVSLFVGVLLLAAVAPLNASATSLAPANAASDASTTPTANTHSGEFRGYHDSRGVSRSHTRAGDDFLAAKDGEGLSETLCKWCGLIAAG